MYQKDSYIKDDPEQLFRFISNHPFATFVLNGDRLLATHIPVLTEGDSKKFRLFGHISREYNEQINYLEDNREALLIFHGPQGYVSSSWYKKKYISTWDYSAVHINVKINIQSDKELEESLQKLVNHFEGEQENPLFYDDIPEDLIQAYMPGITGFWAEPFKVEAVAKFHQGYRAEDVESTIKHLEKKGDPAARQLAEEIRKEHGK